MKKTKDTKSRLKLIYKRLLDAYGRRGWWPVTLKGRSFPTYDGGPRNDKGRLEVIVGAVLTQNTAWKNVEKAIIELNRAALIDVDRLLAVRKPRLASLIRSSGYFNQKAIKLKAAACFLKQNPISELESLDAEKLRKLLLRIKGFGPETADSVVLYAFGKPAFVVDAYTRRIFSRLGFVEPTVGYEELKALFELNLDKKTAIFNEYHALLVEHGKNICKKRPLCSACPLADLCEKKI